MANDTVQKIDQLVEEEMLKGDVIQGEEDRKKIVEYLTEEVMSVETGTERRGMIDMVQTWRRHREARPEEEVKNFPWPGASNIVPPLAMTNTNALTSMLKASLGERKPFWSVGSEDDLLQPQAKALENLLGLMAESRYHMNLRQVNNTIFNDTVSLGTQFVKVPWTVDRWMFKRRGAGGALEQVSKIIKDCPEVVPIRFEDFVTRPFWPDVQRAPWVGQKVWLMEHELLQRKAAGIYNDDVDLVIKRGTDELDANRLETLMQMGIYPNQNSDIKMYAVYELYVYWDVDGDGFPEDVIIWLDPVTGSILRAEFNDLGIRPIVRIPYIERPHELYAMGVGWMMDQLQDASTALMNMYINGTMLAMLQMYVSRRGSGVAPGEQFRPLKNIIVDNPKEDFIPIKFPDLGYGTLQAQMFLKELGDRATGAADAMMGFENRATSARTTASGTMFLAQQGGKLFNAIREGIDQAYSDIGRIAVFQMIRNRNRMEPLLKLLPEDQRTAMEQVLEMNVEDIPTSFRFKVHTTEIEKSEEARKQARLTLVQLYTMYGQQVFQLLPVIYNNQTPPPIKEAGTKFFIGATKMMENMLKDFGEDETRDFLPYIKDIEMMVQAIEAQKDLQLRRITENVQLSQNRSEVGSVPGGSPGAGEPVS